VEASTDLFSWEHYSCSLSEEEAVGIFFLLCSGLLSFFSKILDAQELQSLIQIASSLPVDFYTEQVQTLPSSMSCSGAAEGCSSARVGWQKASEEYNMIISGFLERSALDQYTQLTLLHIFNSDTLPYEMVRTVVGRAMLVTAQVILQEGGVQSPDLQTALRGYPLSSAYLPERLQAWVKAREAIEPEPASFPYHTLGPNFFRIRWAPWVLRYGLSYPKFSLLWPSRPTPAELAAHKKRYFAEYEKLWLAIIGQSPNLPFMLETFASALDGSLVTQPQAAVSPVVEEFVDDTPEDGGL
jgi:hypothetical protein